MTLLVIVLKLGKPRRISISVTLLYLGKLKNIFMHSHLNISVSEIVQGGVPAVRISLYILTKSIEAFVIIDICSYNFLKMC